MLISNDEGAISRAKFLATQAREPELHYQHESVGYNYRLSNVLAGIGRGQLKVLDERVDARRAIFNRYFKALDRIEGLTFMPEATYGKHNRWLTTLTIDPKKTSLTRNDIIQALSEDNIEARPVWKPLHLQPLFDGNKYYKHEESVSEQLFEHGICLHLDQA